MSQSQHSEADTRNIRKACRYFRVLIIGRANAGKTTILQKICNTTETPEVRDPRGKKINLSLLKPSSRRGMHDVKQELVFPNNPRFIFHDSRGFESGGTTELESVKKFIAKRSKEKKLENKLHVIWYCIPTDSSRLLSAAEISFFDDECVTGNVPVIAIFTKFDHGDITAFSALQAEGLDLDEAKRQAPSRSKADFERMHLQRVYETKFPPRNHVYLRDMNKPESNCGDLVEQTADSLNNDILRILFVSSQGNLRVLIKYAVIYEILPPLQKFKNTVLMQKDMRRIIHDILSWFPRNANDLHVGVVERHIPLAALLVPALVVEGVDDDPSLNDDFMGLDQEKDAFIASLLSLAGPAPAVYQILKLGIGLLIIIEYSYSLPQDNRLPRSLAFFQASSVLHAVNEAIDTIYLDKSQVALGKQLLNIVTENLLSNS